jgi:peptidoglycan/LPS O-acetylase OafA/YrhL
VASSLPDLLRPKPFRGDVIAAGVVVLTTLVVSVVLRFHDAWDPEVHLAYVTVAWAFVTAMAVLAPLEGEHPRAYQSILYVASVALLITALIELTASTESHHDAHAARDVTWIGLVVTLYALGFATRRNSAVCTLIAALSGGVTVIAAVAWLWEPDGLSAYRYVGLALVGVYGVLAIGQRDRRLRHGVALIDAAGLAVLAIGLSFVANGFSADSRAADVAWGWELLILAAGFGLIAYSSVDRQPGPAYLGVLNLLLFAAITSLGVSAGGATLWGWPTALALAATALLAIGLRPTTPAPPPPDVDAPEPPPLPWR